MRIIFEGVDGTGKSTVAKYFAEKYHCNIINMTKWGSRKYTDYVDIIRLNNIISDRSVLSELIYKEAFGLNPELKIKSIENLLYTAKILNWKIIILDAPLNIIENRLLKRGNEEQKIIENIYKIKELYIKYAKKYNFPIINTNDSNFLEKIEKEIIK